MNKLLSVATGAAALCFAGAASAAPITFTEGTGTVLNDTENAEISAGSTVDINVQSLANDDTTGEFSFNGSFLNLTGNDALGKATVLQFEPTDLASINNLSLNFSDGMGYTQTFQITDANGNPIGLDGNDVPFLLSIATAATEIFFTFTGEAVASVTGNTLPGLQVSLSEVPIPGALPLLISGIAGLGFASRRRKRADA